MKKYISIILMCIAFSFSLSNMGVYAEEINTQSGYIISFNGEVTEYTSVIHNNTHYIPMRKVFEKMGAVVFYRERDSQILALSRDGDIISHNIGANTITINGERKYFENSSVSENGEAYIPIDMLASTLYPDGIFYDNGQLLILKQIFNSEYNMIIKDVLDQCKNSSFYPERFQKYINFHAKNPKYNMQEVFYRVNLGFDFPFYDNMTTIEYPHELLVLVNKYRKLPDGFNQYNLINMDEDYTIDDGKQYLLSGVAYEKLVKMFEAATKEGLSMKVVSAYRTEDYQEYLYNKYVKRVDKTYADNYSARPGHSEHQTGLAVDINSTKTSFESSSEFAWLQKHAHEYGFILRYPKGKEWITGYSYEPWHYRYVGVDAAKTVYEEGITYEEYYAKYICVNEFR